MRIFTLSVFFSLIAAVASASGLSFNTRADTPGAFGSPASFTQSINALMAQAPGSGYGGTTLSYYDNVSNHASLGGVTSDIASLGVIDFNVAASGVWEFRVTMDFGFAGVILLDGSPVMAWNNGAAAWSGAAAPTETFTLWESMTAGVHQLLIYDAEACCDGPMEAEFLRPGQDWTIFAANDGLGIPSPSSLPASYAPVSAPEPASTGVLAAACVMLALTRRRRGAR